MRLSFFVQTEILIVLYNYDKQNPSEVKWGRSIYSMLIEWDAHNLFSPFTSSAKHTDFDKDEEAKDYEYFVNKAFTRFLKK